jgi:hypothetical protein
MISRNDVQSRHAKASASLRMLQTSSARMGSAHEGEQDMGRGQNRPIGSVVRRKRPVASGGGCCANAQRENSS